MHHHLCIYAEEIWGQYAPLPNTFPNAKWFCVPIVPSYSCFLFDIEVLYQVDQVCGETHLYHDIEQLVVAYIVKGLAVINKSDEGSLFGLTQFLYHDLKYTDQVCNSLIFLEMSLFFWKLLRNFLL